MKSKNALCGLSIAVVLHFGELSGSAQTNKYLFTGSKTNITLNPGAYIITAYGGPGGYGGWGIRGLGAEMAAEFYFPVGAALTLLVGGGPANLESCGGGGGGTFIVEGSTPLVIAGGGGGSGTSEAIDPGVDGNVSTTGGDGGSVGRSSGGTGGTGGGGGGAGYNDVSGGGGGFLGNGGGNGGGYSCENGGGGGGAGGLGAGGFGGGGYGGGELGGGGGGYSGDGSGGWSGFVGGDGGGGGGGSIIDSSAIAVLDEVSGIASPDDSTNGEIIITAVPTPLAITTLLPFAVENGVFGFNVIGPSGSNVVIQSSTDLQNWIPLQTNVLGSGPLYFSDTNAPANVQRFYRAQFSPFRLQGDCVVFGSQPDYESFTTGLEVLALTYNLPYRLQTTLMPGTDVYRVMVLETNNACEVAYCNANPQYCTLTQTTANCAPGAGPELPAGVSVISWGGSIACDDQSWGVFPWQ